MRTPKLMLQTKVVVRFITRAFLLAIICAWLHVGYKSFRQPDDVELFRAFIGMGWCVGISTGYGWSATED